MEYAEKIISYYRKQAEEHGVGSSSTMPDVVVREKEIEAILRFLSAIPKGEGRQKLLEVGCGNGYLLEVIAKKFGDRFELFGVDLTPEQVRYARARETRAHIQVGDINKLDFADACFDVLLSERVVINVLDPNEQLTVYQEFSRVLKSDGLAMLIEGFKSGLENLNRARQEFSLPPIPEPEVNNWYTEERWQKFLGAGFTELGDKFTEDLVPENFLSSHYFMTRFFHDLIRPEKGKLRNTEFAFFFAQALPPVGDYSPLRIKYLRRNSRGED